MHGSNPKNSMPAISELTLGQIAIEIPSAAAVFEKYRIDYACGGRRHFLDVCCQAGLNPAQIEAEIAAGAPIATPQPSWTTVPLPDLIRYLVEADHPVLRKEAVDLDRMAVNNAASNRAENPQVIHSDFPSSFHNISTAAPVPARRADALSALDRILKRLTQQLSAHIDREDTVVFPAILRLEAARKSHAVLPKPAFGSVRHPIWMMEQEHRMIAGILKQAQALARQVACGDSDRDVPGGLGPPLEAFELHIYRNFHLENNVLYPRAARLEEEQAS